MNPRILIVAAALIVVLVIGAVAVYFTVFKKTAQVPQQTAEELAAKADDDGDGFPNIQENEAGTDPKDARRYPGSHKKVLTAKTNVPANTLMREDMFQVKEVAAKGESPDAAVTEADKARVVGHISAVDIKEGDFMVESMIFSGKPQLSFLVPKYKRAVSIRYDELADVSGLIELGDQVDVIGYFSMPRPDNNGFYEYSKIIVQNARIVAKGQGFMPRDPADTSVPPPTVGITLTVFPHEAERIVWAENKAGGALRLALRSPQNDVFASTSGTTEQTAFDRQLSRRVEMYSGATYSGVVNFVPQSQDRMGGVTVTAGGPAAGAR